MLNKSTTKQSLCAQMPLFHVDRHNVWSLWIFLTYQFVYDVKSTGRVYGLSGVVLNLQYGAFFSRICYTLQACFAPTRNNILLC